MNKIKYLREINNMTQEKLGELIGVKSSAVSKYEKGIVPLTDDTILKLSEIFNVSSDFLLGNEIRNSQQEEKEILKKILTDNGFMKNKDDLSNEELDKLMKFVVANKEFLKNDKN